VSAVDDVIHQSGLFGAGDIARMFEPSRIAPFVYRSEVGAQLPKHLENAMYFAVTLHSQELMRCTF
jgi:hypothetical protein